MPMLTYQPELGQLYGLNLFGDFYRVQVVTNPANKHTNTKVTIKKELNGFD